MARDPNHEVRKRYEESFGLELGSVFSELWQEITWLYTVWREYRVIFGTSAEQLDVANRAPGTFFYIVQKSIWESVLLHLACLTDPATMGRKHNLSVARLRELVNPELSAEVSRLCDACIDATGFARDWRNRYIAHKDLDLALSDSAAPPLQAASRAAVELALQALSDLMNTIDRAYNDTSTMFAGIESHSGAKRLLSVIGKGLEAEMAQDLADRKRWGIE